MPHEDSRAILLEGKLSNIPLEQFAFIAATTHVYGDADRGTICFSRLPQ